MKTDFNATITLKYLDYQELERSYKKLMELLCMAKNSKDFDKELKKHIEEQNKHYGWWA